MTLALPLLVLRTYNALSERRVFVAEDDAVALRGDASLRRQGLGIWAIMHTSPSSVRTATCYSA